MTVFRSSFGRVVPPAGLLGSDDDIFIVVDGPHRDEHPFSLMFFRRSDDLVGRARRETERDGVAREVWSAARVAGGAIGVDLLHKIEASKPPPPRWGRR